MKLKNEIEYVFRILNYLSLQDKDRIVTSTEIAENENIPHLFSIRVLKKMEKTSSHMSKQPLRSEEPLTRKTSLLPSQKKKRPTMSQN